MAAINQDIGFDAGEDIAVSIPIVKAGEPLDVEGATFTWKMYHTLTGIVLEKDNLVDGNGGISINVDEESVTLAFAKADTEALIPLTYDHELRIHNSTNAENIITSGLLRLGQSITLIGVDS
jgi:hypothetical protein